MFVCLKVDDDVISYGSIQYNGEVPCPRIKYDTFGGSIAFGSETVDNSRYNKVLMVTEQYGLIGHEEFLRVARKPIPFGM